MDKASILNGEEGIKAIKVRNIAGVACCLYANLDIYFRHVNDLVFEGLSHSYAEHTNFVCPKMDADLRGYEAIKAKAMTKKCLPKFEPL